MNSFKLLFKSMELVFTFDKRPFVFDFYKTVLIFKNTKNNILRFKVSISCL
jgi:hypothetical protein